MLTHFGSTAVRARGPGEILDILRTFPPPMATARPTLLLHAQGDIPSLIEAIQTASAGLPGSVVEVISRHQHQPAELPSGLLAYLPRWFNHIDLKANAEVYVKVATWLASQIGAPPA